MTKEVHIVLTKYSGEELVYAHIVEAQDHGQMRIVADSDFSPVDSAWEVGLWVGRVLRTHRLLGLQ